MRKFVDALRRSLWLDAVNLRVKRFLHPDSPKYAARLALLRTVQKQGHEPFISAEPQIFIDISSLVGRDGGTGIHRVVRSVALHAARMGFFKGRRLSLVYASKYREGYWHAFRFQREVLGVGNVPEVDAPIRCQCGDIFFELDWNTRLVPLQRAVYRAMEGADVPVIFHIYDILPLQLAEFNDEKARRNFEAWLVDASSWSGAMFTAQAVLNDYMAWRRERIIRNTMERCAVGEARAALREDFAVDWYWLGSDIEASLPTRGMSEADEALLSHLRGRSFLLMVSSLEPRKGYEQALAAFELLWERGAELDLVVVGRAQGNETLARKFREHGERGRRFFWLDDASDEVLEALYDAASGVLFASFGEGFGLAVWEGAHHGRPLILRDIPVFRELAGEHATYFSGKEPEALADCLERWLAAREAGALPDARAIHPLTWEESVHMLLSRLVRLAERSGKSSRR